LRWQAHCTANLRANCAEADALPTTVDLGSGDGAVAVGGAAYGAVEVTQEDAQRIAEYTGVSGHRTT
jgi:predicted RNA methylase